ncbi:MAG: hypothetical protein HKN33_18335 [Pyrinomonadaceae bacterium]|nr:hypothetical protein [Pyrinomonadaceae bacterium]
MKFLASILVVLAFTALGSAQPKPAFSVLHTVHEIESEVLDESREILVHVPLNYKRHNRKLPVIYMLDGHTPHPEMMAGILANQSWGGMIPEMILVSIRNTNRNRDMLPTRDEQYPNSGGADKFLDFIQNEVFPVVEKNYRVQPYRLFAGHSFSALTVVYALTKRPEMFDSYIAASPSLWWDEEAVVKMAKKELTNKPRAKTIFLALGDEPDMVKPWKKLQAVFKKVKGLDYEFRDFKKDSHLSVVLPAYYSGLLKIFDGFRMSGRIRSDTVVPHYEALSKKYGFKVIPPEDLLNASGYFLMREKRFSDALKLFRENASNYPESANVYDSLGECLEKMNKLEEAAFNYEKAMNMASDGGNRVLTAAAKANLKRVNEALEKKDGEKRR